ncbi:hypothetical protein ACFV1W_28110 [Kitasatospora sp. NPDC059648]|uniref:hypothetical protein n=1 Tax=Kitasatospora sp. NPDC059648 TaxID=3346894 RepID=UPI0036A33E04
MEKLHGIDEHRIPVACINAPLAPGSYAEWSAALATFLGWDVYRPGTDHQPPAPSPSPSPSPSHG